MHLQQDQICHRKGKTTIRCELIDLANNFNSEKIEKMLLKIWYVIDDVFMHRWRALGQEGFDET